jgi:hypothetical protein
MNILINVMAIVSLVIADNIAELPAGGMIGRFFST